VTGFRRRRSRDDSEYAEYLGQLTTASYDGTTWEGASDVGLPGGDPARPAAAGEAGPGTIPLDRVRELGYQAWHQRPAAALEAPAPPLPPPPDRPFDAAIFVEIPAGWVMLCGLCCWRRPKDIVPQDTPRLFEAIRDSACDEGWQLDRFARWACAKCQMGSDYYAPWNPVHYASEWGAAWHEYAPGQWAYTDPAVPPKPVWPTEFGFEVIAEYAALQRAHASRCRTAIITRPDGRRLAARIIAGNKDYQPRHTAGAS
jgi:hypothetical protein